MSTKLITSGTISTICIALKDLKIVLSSLVFSTGSNTKSKTAKSSGYPLMSPRKMILLIKKLILFTTGSKKETSHSKTQPKLMKNNKNTKTNSKSSLSSR
jgi:hypothetical protein